MVVTYSTLDEAEDNCDDSECVAGAYHEESGEPMYIVVKKDISDFEMTLKAWEVRYGKPITNYGAQVTKQAMQMKGRL